LVFCKSCKKESQSRTWKLVFEDNFSGSEVDTSQWLFTFPWYSMNFAQFYDKDHVYLENGHLIFFGEKNDTNAKGVPYLPAEEIIHDGFQNFRKFLYKSGMLYHKQGFHFGKFEIRCKIPEGSGLWPAFWIYGECNHEIDIFEFDGDYTEYMHTTVHYKPYCNGDRKGQLPYKHKASERLSNDYHIYTCIWEKDRIQWLLDGEVVREDIKFNSSVAQNYFPNEELHVIMNLAVGGPFPENKPNAQSLPAKMYID
jgi:beta-glucanase (GH16 family)